VWDRKARPCFFQELAFMPASHQYQEADLLPTNQLRLGRDLKAGSSSLRVLWCYTVVAAFGVLLYDAPGF
jgi:hypothetical protein